MKLPIDYLAHPETDAQLRDHLGVAGEKELLDALHCDFFYLPGRDISQNEGALSFYKHREKLAMSASERVCPLCIRWQRGAYDSKFAVDEALRGPLEEPMIASRDILDHSWPSADDFDFSPLLELAEQNRDRTRIGGLWTGIMGDSYRLHGFENFLLNLAMNPSVMHTLVDRMTDMYMELNDTYTSARCTRHCRRAASSPGSVWAMTASTSPRPSNEASSAATPPASSISPSPNAPSPSCSTPLVMSPAATANFAMGRGKTEWERNSRAKPWW